MAINPNRLQAFAYATVLALAGAWILHIGRDALVPLVFSVLVACVIVGLAEHLARLPRLGPLLPERARNVLSVLVIMVALAGVAMLVVAHIGAVVAPAPKFQASLLDAIHGGAERLGMEAAPTWGSLRQGVTQVCILLCLVSWAAMAWAGLEFAAFWAVLTALLNYNPVPGFIPWRAVPRRLRAHAVRRPQRRAAVAGAAVDRAVRDRQLPRAVPDGQLAKPQPLRDPASLAARSALWGVAGAFLAVSTTALLARVCSSFEGTRGVAVPLSRGGEA